MDEPLTMERGGQTYYYHRDALGSVTEVSDATGAIVERYEYDVYGEVTIYDGSDNALTASAIGNPYLFTGRRYDAESDNYYYRARYYSHKLGRFLSEDPLGFDAGDYNLYRYVFNNPTNAVDPTGEFAFLPWLLKASAEAAVDALMQGVVGYFFDPNITTAQQAIENIDMRQVGVAFVTGLLPGGALFKSALAASGDVLINYLDALDACQEYTPEQALTDFAISMGTELIGDKIGDWVVKYGTQAISAGLRKLGLDELAEKLLRNADKALVGPGHTNPEGFRYTSDLAPNDPRIIQKQSILNENATRNIYNKASDEWVPLPFADRDYFAQCEMCSRKMLQNGDTIMKIGSIDDPPILVDKKRTGNPHYILISPEGLVWDAPTNTWGQRFENYIYRITIPR